MLFDNLTTYSNNEKMTYINNIYNFIVFALKRFEIIDNDTQIEIKEKNEQKLKIRLFEKDYVDLFVDVDIDDITGVGCWFTIKEQPFTSLTTYKLFIEKLQTIKNCVVYGVM